MPEAVRMLALIRPSTRVSVSRSDVTWRDDDVSRCADECVVRMRSETSSTSLVLLAISVSCSDLKSTVNWSLPSKLTLVASVLNTERHYLNKQVSISMSVFKTQLKGEGRSHCALIPLTVTDQIKMSSSTVRNFCITSPGVWALSANSSRLEVQ